MINNITKELKKTKSYENDFGESIPVVRFSEIGLKDLRSLTSYKVGQVIESRWLPNGLIAWKVAEDGRKLSLVFFRGRAAVVTEVKSGESYELRELLNRASMLHHLGEKKIVSMCA